MTASPTVAAALAEAVPQLQAAAVPQPRLEVRLLLSHATRLSAEAIIGHPERALDADEAASFAALLARRRRREPLAQILGRREFWSLSFKVTRDTLSPRPESETLVEAALAGIPDRGAPLAVLDLGAGTGCLLLALLSELPRARGIAVERSLAACRVAHENAEALGLAERSHFIVGDWGEAIAARFDLVVANPPYIPAALIEGLEPEIARFEPRLALSGGADGLESYRALAVALPRLLAPAGRAVIELGQGQGDAVTGIFAESGLQPLGRRLDLAGIERCLIMAPSPLANH
ncbi:MAG TPA: peptide chain release factor N(5)-glutamine methyltransferase [Alphaproteobacteria bacterium]|nr:peptide chain release factor N(5)-glutamine methyltransferase [Alphaproteobacteria bacterium]